MPASRYYANLYGSAALSSFTGVPLRDTQCGYRLLRTAMLRRLRLRATGYDIETEMLIKVSRLGGRISVGSGECGVWRRAQQAPAGARHDADMLSRGVLSLHRARVVTTEQQPQAGNRPLRWTRHGLNNGVIFWLTVRGVRTLPRSVSYAIGHVGTWIAWRLMRATTKAVAAKFVRGVSRRVHGDPQTTGARHLPQLRL